MNNCSNCGKPLTADGNFCIHCGTSINGDTAKRNFHNKKERVLGKQSGKATWTKYLIIGGILFVAGGWIYYNLPKPKNPIIEVQPVVSDALPHPQTIQQMVDISVTVANGKIKIPLNVVKERKFVAFTYNGQGKEVPLLAYISGEGKVVTAVSMCEPCNSKRFHIQGENLVCNSCGTTWKLDNLEAVSGGCSKFPPDAIPSVVEGNEIQIDENLVAGWQRRI